MASSKPDLPRDGTMQTTAKEGIALLEAAGKTTLLEMQGLKTPEEDKPAVNRETTMEATAKEGQSLLAGSSLDPDAATRGQQQKLGEIKEEAPAAKKPRMSKATTMVNTAKEAKNLLGASAPDQDAHTRGQQKKIDEIQTEEVPAAKKPRMTKATTMVNTAKEAKNLLGANAPDQDAHTRGQQKKIDEIQTEEVPAAKKPRMTKATTMVNTAKEAKNLLGASAPDQDAHTRGQQKKIEDIQTEKPSPKKPKLSKNTTMAATAKEGSALLEGEKLGDTRQETKSKTAPPPPPKRSRTIQKTMDEAKWVLNTDKVDLTEGRRTRSASKPKPALTKAGTMEATAKEGKEFLSRGKKGKKAAPKKSEETIDEEEVGSGDA